jgi:hypothetical protein
VNSKTFNRLMLAWLVGCFVFWAWYLAFHEFAYQTLYFYVWLIVFGLPVWFYRRKIRDFLLHLKMKGRAKFLLLGYGMVLLEEIFAALFNHLSEGFHVFLYIQRVGQFWALNIMAFTGFVVGWWVLTSRLKYSDSEVFYLAGIFGLYSERVYAHLATNVLAVLLLAPLVIFTYGLIITPALLSIEQPGKRYVHPVLKFPLSLAAIFILSIPPVLLLSILRTHYPWAFPPPEFVPL